MIDVYNDSWEKHLPEIEKLKKKQVFNVLVIDDDKMILELFKKYLESWGFSILTAMNPYIGVSLAISHNPVIIILDIYLPELSGEKILKLFKSIEITSNIPIIIVSGNLNHDILNSTYSEGAAGFLSKPFLKEDLFNNIKRVLNPVIINSVSFENNIE